MALLDVGHGSAAVLRDEAGVVVFDTGRGAHVGQYLSTRGVHEVQALFLSHADADHVGGAVTLLLNTAFRVGRVYLNPDASKDTDVFAQLRYALSDSEQRAGTRVEPSLTTSTSFPRNGAQIEVLYPAPSTALAGVGGVGLSGQLVTSNSLSAAIRVTGSPLASVLLCGDVERSCLEEWKRQGLDPSAGALVFPHHGGLPGDGDETAAVLFARELTEMVVPRFVLFSIHRNHYNLPRDKILAAIATVAADVRFVCTQLPSRLHSSVMKDPLWSLHRHPSGQGTREVTVELVLANTGLGVGFEDLD